MGAVWCARHVITDRRVAIKVLDEAYLRNEQVVRRFGREARVASAIQHPGIVEVLDLDQTPEGLPFLVMEFLEGETLAGRIERRGRLGQDELIRLGSMLLEALDAAHTHGVIHRDLKPENIFVVPAGRRGETVKILDFGISQMREEGDPKLTVTGSVLGTPHYMSPEQAMGETEVDHRADLYATGVVLYECAVGDVPFDAPNYNKLLRLILDEEPLPPRARGAQISSEVERVIQWAMEKDRERRLPTARDMRMWLRRAAAGERVPHPSSRSSSSPALRSASVPTPVGSSWRMSEPPAVVPRAVGHDAPTANAGEFSWEVSPTLMRRVEPERRARRPPPPQVRSGSGELHLGFDLESAPLAETPLELDESALRTSSSHSPARRSMPPAAGTSSNSGSFPAVGGSSGARASTPGIVAVAGDGLRSSIPSRAPLSSQRPGARASSAAGPFTVGSSVLRTWRRGALVGLGSLVLFVALVALVRWMVRPGVEDEALPVPSVASESPMEDAPPAHPKPSWVSVEVVGLPPGARLRLDGLPARSPLRVHAGGLHVVEIRADGYEDRRIEFQADRNRTLHARMRPALGTPPSGR